MFRRKIALLLSIATISATAPAFAQTKQVITTASEVPPVVIALPSKPSVVIMEGGASYDMVREELQAYAQRLNNEYEIRDPATKKQALALLLQVAMAEDRWDDVLSFSQQIEALEDKPAAKATAGLISRAYARAAMAVGEESLQFADRFQQEFQKSVQAVDWTLGQDTLQGMRSQFQTISRDLLVGSLQGGLDPNAEAQSLKVGAGIASAIVGSRQMLTELLPLKDRIFAVLDNRVKSQSAQVKEDRWTPRLVTLHTSEVKAPVNVAIWDSGLDPAVFKDRMWTNTNETMNGRDNDNNGFIDDVHGIAFDPDWQPATGMLRPMPEGSTQSIAEKLNLAKGSLDMSAAVESPEADALRTKLASLKPDEVMPFMLDMGALSLYLHGTSTGYTSILGNPAARIMNARFDSKITAVPDPMDEKVGAAMADYVKMTVDYFKKHNARVVNMSWRVTEPMIAATLASVEPDPEKRKIRAKAIFDNVNEALEQSLQNAPNILFVAGAGNEDEDVDFVRSFPAGINLPNVITVGAVDSALQPAGFTSYGQSIDLYANGHEIPSKVPGGMDINISGTSLAAPQVTNTAAKMLAVNPTLTVAQLRTILESTANKEGAKGLKVINPAAAVSRASD